jgi:hypothetical protein
MDNNTISPETQHTTPASPDTKNVDQTRRKLAGLGASAIFTLASRPVLAGDCNTPSAAASGNLSTHGTPPQCSGLSPSAWVDAKAGEDVTFHVANTNNNKDGSGVFVSNSTVPACTVDWGGKTLFQVMDASGTGNSGKTPNPISAEFAAALLNIRAQKIPSTVLDESRLIMMWYDWSTTGVFEPRAGGSWEARHIVDYLRSLYL